MFLALWILPLLFLFLPFGLRAVDAITDRRLAAWRRAIKAAVWAIGSAVAIAGLLSGLLGAGRAVAVITTPEGRLILVWSFVAMVAFVALGAIAHRLGFWIR